jgi:hypothetical protein
LLSPDTRRPLKSEKRRPYPSLPVALGDHLRKRASPGWLGARTQSGAFRQAAGMACQFLFLPRIGHDWTLRLMAALNALIGSYFLFGIRPSHRHL